MSVRLALASAALGAAAALSIATLWPPNDPSPLGSDPRQAERIRELEARIRELSAQTIGAAPEQAPMRTAADQSIEPLKARIAELERQLANTRTAGSDRPEPSPSLQSPDADPIAVAAARRAAEEAARTKRIEEARSVLFDAQADAATKLAAHESLRRVRDAYDDAMVRELLTLASTLRDGKMRADIWRFFDGASSLPQLVSPMLTVLATDSDARAREEVVETLGNYGDNPGVIAELERAAEFDASQRVRDKAKRTLHEIRRR